MTQPPQTGREKLGKLLGVDFFFFFGFIDATKYPGLAREVTKSPRTLWSISRDKAFSNFCNGSGISIALLGTVQIRLFQFFWHSFLLIVFTLQ